MSQLSFGSNQKASLEAYQVQLQKNKDLFTAYDAITKEYCDFKVQQAKDIILGGASTAYDTLKEIEVYLSSNDNLSSALLSAIQTTSANLASEIQRANDAEALLSTRILDEQKAREANDNSLRADLTSESSNRSNADNLLSVRVDDEKKQREASDLVLDGKITTVDAKADTYYGLLIEKDNQNMNTVYSIQSQLEATINAEKARAESVEASKFDKAGGAISGSVSLNLSETTNTYLNLSPVWRVVCSNSGDRVQFEFYKDNQWTVALPFIMGV